MAKPEHYVPRVKDTVVVDGVSGGLVVVGVDARQQVARVATITTPIIVHTVSWSKLSRLDSSQNALQIVREATKDN
jgi:hypothetical protein